MYSPGIESGAWLVGVGGGVLADVTVMVMFVLVLRVLLPLYAIFAIPCPSLSLSLLLRSDFSLSSSSHFSFSLYSTCFFGTCSVNSDILALHAAACLAALELSALSSNARSLRVTEAGMDVSLVTYLSRMSPYDTCEDKLSSPSMRVFSDTVVLVGVVFLLLL